MDLLPTFWPGNDFHFLLSPISGDYTMKPGVSDREEGRVPAFEALFGKGCVEMLGSIQKDIHCCVCFSVCRAGACCGQAQLISNRRTNSFRIKLFTFDGRGFDDFFFKNNPLGLKA